MCERIPQFTRDLFDCEMVVFALLVSRSRDESDSQTVRESTIEMSKELSVSDWSNDWRRVQAHRYHSMVSATFLQSELLTHSTLY
jgi:hypothetical protein